MSNSNTVRRALCTLAFLLLVVQVAAAQSTLNFPRAISDSTGISIINPNPYTADVQLTFYGADGNPVTNLLVNPVNYRVGPKSQLQMMSRDAFGLGNRSEGWIQVTSTSTGLAGFYFTGNFTSTLDGSDPVPGLTTQALPLIREDQNTHTDLMIINPGATATTVTLTLFDIQGREIGNVTQSISPHAVLRYRPGANYPIIGSAGTWVRVTSTSPVTATAVVESAEASMFVNGQAVDQTGTTRILPHFVNGNGASTQLILSNPNTFSVDATVTLYSATGGAIHVSQSGPSVKKVTIPAHGLISLDAGFIAQLPFPPVVDGFVKVETGNAPLNGLAVLDRGSALSAIPLQRLAADRMIFSQLTDSPSLYAELNLVNASSTAAALDVSVIRTNGTVLVQKKVGIPANSKLSGRVRDLIPEAAGQSDGFLYIRSSAGIYGVELLAGANQAFISTVVPQRTNLDFNPNPVVDQPQITRIDPGTEITAGMKLHLNASTTASDTQVLLGNLTLTPTLTPPFTLMSVDIPAIEPGYVQLRIRVRGVESESVTMHVLPLEDEALTPINGVAFYQKIEVNDSGLDLTHPTMTPIRNARVEVLDAVTRAIISVSETGNRGQFIADVPQQSAVVIRVLSRLRSSNLQVADNTSGNALYSISTDFDYRESNQAVLVDKTRTSGAFNILEMIERANDLMRLTDPSLILPAPTMFWSVRNTIALVPGGTTYFKLTDNTAFVLGDRSSPTGADSDEFDDSVILHEYGHILAARFSRDDSPGGGHAVGENLDPRLAWSEGFANFFSGVVRNDATYRDSRDLNGSRVMKIDLEDNQPPNDPQGYGSEASIHSLLWDMFDSLNEGSDTVQYSFSMIWDAVADLKNNRFVYVPFFLERFLDRNPGETETIRAMVQARSIDFFPNVRPSVSNPWPRLISLGVPVTGNVDSYTPTRDKEHQATAAHFFTFTTTTDRMVAIRLNITGLGPGRNANFNDLDIFLTDLNGTPVDRSDLGLNGQSELITRRLPAGTYVIEIRSYYTKAETNAKIYNSGDYSLTLTAQ